MPNKIARLLPYFFSWLCISVGVIGSAAPQQTPHTHFGQVEGRVVDPTNAVVPEAKVTLESGSRTYSTTTGKDGIYRLEAPEGEYGFRVQSPGFCYRRASFRMHSSGHIVINAVIAPCVVAYVVTIGPGKQSSARDELQSMFQEQTIPITSRSGPPLELLITYSRRRDYPGGAEYEGGCKPGVVITYDTTTVYASKVWFDKTHRRFHAEGCIVVEDGISRRMTDRADLEFDDGKATVMTN